MIQYRMIAVKDNDFSIDTVISLAFAKKVFPGIDVKRCDMKKAEDGVLAIGMGKGDFDPEGKHLKDNNNMPYSCMALLWDAFGTEYLNTSHFTKVSEAFQLFVERIIEKINEGTAFGFRNVKMFWDAGLIHSFTPYWYENTKQNNCNDALFADAVAYAEILLENWTREIFEETEVREIENEIWKEAEDNSNDGIVILEERIPWLYQIKQNPETTAKVIICKSNRGGYNVMSKDPAEIAISGVEYLTYLHPSLFMGVAETLENAILAAKSSLSAIAG